MIAKLEILRVDDEDGANPYRVIAYDEHGDRITQVRYEEEWEAVSGARRIKRWCSPDARISDLLKKD